MSSRSHNISVLYYYLDQIISKIVGFQITNIGKDEYKENDLPSVETIIQRFKNLNKPANVLSVNECTSIIESFSNFEKLIIIRALIFHSFHYKYDATLKNVFQHTAFNILLSVINNQKDFESIIKVFMYEGSQKRHPFFYELFISNGHNDFTDLCKKDTNIMKIIKHLWYNTDYTDIYADIGYETHTKDPITQNKKIITSYTRSLDIKAATNWNDVIYTKWINYMTNFEC